MAINSPSSLKLADAVVATAACSLAQSTGVNGSQSAPPGSTQADRWSREQGSQGPYRKCRWELIS